MIRKYMNKEELLKAVNKLIRYDLEYEYAFDDREVAFIGNNVNGDYLQYEDVIDLINELYEQSK